MASYTQLGEPCRHPGATMHFLKKIGAFCGFGGKNIVVDSGIGFTLVNGVSKTYTADIDRLDGVHIDLIIITHAHADHIVGAIVLAARHSEAIIIMSQPTLLAGWINCRDTLKIAENNQRQAKKLGLTPEPLLFDEADLINFFERVVPIYYPQWLTPPGWKGWEIGFSNCGHQRGAMSIFILPPHGRPIWITGDTSSHDVELTRGVFIPSEEFLGDFLKRKGVVLITEATNGARFYNDLTRDAEKAKLRAIVKEVRDRNGRVFHPAFAQDRPGSLVSFYAELGIPTHVDGLAREFLRTYAEPDSMWCEDDIPFPLDDLMAKGLVFFFEEDDKDAAKAHRMMADRGYDSCAQFSPIISPSATMEKGFAVGHAIEILPQRESACIFAGHIFSNTPSEELMQMSDPTERVKRGNTIKLFDYNNRRLTPVDVRCDVMKVDWTGHDGGQALVERAAFVGESSDDVLVIGHHGDDKNRKALEEGVKALGLRYLDGTYLEEYDL